LGLVACAVFKTAGRRHWWLRWVRFPHAPASARWPQVRRPALAAAVALLAIASVLGAQVVPRQQQQRRPEPEDTIPVPAFRYNPPISPLSALGRSMLLPGWGQAALGRRGPGAFFVFWEGLSLTMTLKSAHQRSYKESIDEDPDAIDAKRGEFQDWLVLVIFNHLVAGAEAFVSAQLWDFPVELEARQLPNGRVGLGWQVSWTFAPL